VHVQLPIHHLKPLVLLLTAGFLAVACGSSNVPTAGTDQGSPGAGADANTGEGIPVPYTDSRFHYKIDAPGRMALNPDGSVAYVGPSERIEISIVQGAAASDPATLASQDVKSLSTGALAFRQLSSPTKITLNGYHVTRFAYTWSAGTNSVTGKPIELTSVRYYVSKDASTLAVITYGIVTNQFDPQGADDIVSTFQWQ
jgi:hypothetical protein